MADTEFGVGEVNDFADCCVNQVRQRRGGGAMIWAEISEQGKTDLVFMEGNLNAVRYIDQVRRPLVVPSA